MRGPTPPALTLMEAERQRLESITRRHSAPQQLALRARLVLAAGRGLNNAQIARQEAVEVDTVRLWRSRWSGLQPVPLTELSVEERLADAPRAGRTATLSAEQVCQIVALACEAPSQTGRPISQWTGREMADEIQKRGIVAKISGRHAARLLKRGTCNRI